MFLGVVLFRAYLLSCLDADRAREKMLYCSVAPELVGVASLG